MKCVSQNRWLKFVTVAHPTLYICLSKSEYKFARCALKNYEPVSLTIYDIKLHLRSKYGEIAVVWWQLLFRQRELASPMAKWWAILTGSEISFREYQVEAFKFYFSRDTNWTIVIRIWKSCEGYDKRSFRLHVSLYSVLWHFQNGYSLSVSFSPPWHSHTRIACCYI